MTTSSTTNVRRRLIAVVFAGVLAASLSTIATSEIIILNVAWLRPAPSVDQNPDLPPQVSASWAFAVEASP